MKYLRGPTKRTAPSNTDIIKLFQSETAEVRAEQPPALARITLWLIATMIVLLVILSTVFKIDRVVTAVTGQIVTTDPVVVLQPIDQSIIKTLDVREGDHVSAGQILATLDPTFVSADVNTLRLQITGLDAQIARCKAELEQKPFLISTDVGLKEKTYWDMQVNYFNAHKAAIDSQLFVFDQQILQQRAAIARYTTDFTLYLSRQKLAKEIQDMHQSLAAKQFDSRLNLLEATDQAIEVQRNLETVRNSLVENQHQLEALKASRNAFIEQQQALTGQELISALNQHDNLLQQLDKAEKHQELIRVIAPDEAIVLKMASLSVGSVVQPSEPLFELAKLHAPMEAEIFIRPADVGYLRAGDDVTVKLDSYPYTEHGWAEGRIRWISPGTFAMQKPAPGSSGESSATGGGGAYYKARVALTRLNLIHLPSDARLIPGMTLEADIHVGRRSVFWYLAEGLVRNGNEAMRER